MALLEIRELTIDFETGAVPTRAVDHVSLTLEQGRVLGLVGESGSGKTTLGLAITKLLPRPPARIAGGEILVEGQDTLRLSDMELRRMRGGRVSYVFQEPSTSLNPVMTIGSQLVETLELHTPLRAQAARDRAAHLLERVGLPSARERLDSYPHELSGGMKQRVMLAMAVAPGSRLIVADEPTTALDVTLERQIVALLKQLQAELGLSLLVISHNIHLIARLADRVAVMWRGRLVEVGQTAQVLHAPQHDYTKQLLAAQPRVPALEGG